MSTIVPCKYDWQAQCCSCGGSGGRTESIEHQIRRERFYDCEDRIFFTIDGQRVLAAQAHDVKLIYHTKTVWHGGVGLPLQVDDYPACPDCDGGEIAWAEAGGVPGSRECDTCGSRYIDTTFGFAAEVPT